MALYDCTNENLVDGIQAKIEEHLKIVPLPSWFVADYVTGLMHSCLADIAYSGKCYLNTLVENIAEESIYNCCQSIRSAVYAIVVQKSKPYVKEYVRKFDKVEQNMVLWKQFPSLEEMPYKDLEYRKQLLLTVFEISSKQQSLILKFHTNLWPFLCATSYWRKKTIVIDWTFNGLVTCAFGLLLKYCVDEDWLRSKFMPDEECKPAIVQGM